MESHNIDIAAAEGTENDALITGSTGTSNENRSNNKKKDLLKELEFGPIPKKRGNKANHLLRIIIIFSTLFVLGVYSEEKGHSTVILNCALTFFGVILGALVNCLCFAFEELFHCKERYEGSCWKMFKTCFSVIDRSMILGIILSIPLVYIYYKTTGEGLQLIHAALIFSNIGIGSLIHHLLKLDKSSQLHISITCEENKTSVVNTLAWHYYYDHIEVVLKELERHGIEKSQRKDLDSMKLFILIPLDCIIDIRLLITNQQIRKVGVIKCEKECYEVGVYQFGNDDDRICMFEFPSPLNTIYEMYKDKDILKRETRLFYRALKDILEEKANKKIKGRYELIPYKPEKLLNYELATLMRELVPRKEGTTQGQPAENDGGTTSRQQAEPDGGTTSSQPAEPNGGTTSSQPAEPDGGTRSSQPAESDGATTSDANCSSAENRNSSHSEIRRRGVRVTDSTLLSDSTRCTNDDLK